MEPQVPDAPTASRHPGRWSDLLWLAAAGAVVAALTSVAVAEFQFRALGKLTWTSRDFAVLAWLGNTICFAVVLPFIAAGHLLTRRLSGLWFAAFGLGSLSLWAICIMLPHIHPIAQGLLALGLGTQVANAIARAPLRWMPRVRMVATVGTGSIALLGLITVGVNARHERRSLAALGAADPNAPNIILLILDTVRAANLSAYGYERPTTPVLARLAREGILFEQAISAASWTAPSHASMMTGLRAGEAEADYLRPMTRTAPTVAEVLAGRGYVTAGFVANAGFAGYQMGIARGFSHFEDYPFSWQQALWSSTLIQTRSGLDALEAIDKRQWSTLRRVLRDLDLRRVVVRRGRESSAAEVSQKFLAWRDRVEPGRPYFALLNFIDAHAPYSAPDGFEHRFNGGRSLIDKYDGSIAYVDSVVGTLVERLRDSGDLERTWLLVTSDHGELFGEHDLRGHGSSLYRPVLHVPLVVRSPGSARSGIRVPAVASLRDMAATLIDLAGVPPGTLPGSSLVPLWSDSSTASVAAAISEASAAVNPAPRNLTRFGPIRGAMDSTWHYIRYGDGREQLFAWRTDPDELHDAAGTPAGAAEAARYRELVARALNVHPPPAPRTRP